jgi:twinkle protein
MTYDKKQKGRPMNTTPTETIHDVKKYPVRAIKDRGIDLATAELYGIRTKLSGDDGTTPVAYYFPYYDNTGKRVVGYKKRDLLKSKKEGFSAIGDVSLKQPLFGSHTLLGKDKFKLYICEGEFDAACLNRALKVDQKVSGKEEYAIHVTSIGMGTINAVEHIMNNLELIEQYKEVILVFDNDKATPEEKTKGIVLGQDAVEDVALALTDMSVKYVKLPLKDPCEMYAAKRTKELINSCKWGAMEYKPEHLMTFSGEEHEIQELMKPMSKGIYLKCVPELCKMMKGFRKHEMSILLANVKSGKSTLSKEIVFDMVKQHNWKVANFYLEESALKSQQSYVAMYHNVRPARYRENPNILTPEQVKEARDWMQDNMLFYDCEKAGKTSPESMLRMAKHVAIMGYDCLVLDHVSFIMSGSEGGNERRDLDNMITELSMVARSYPIHIWLVAHIKREDYNPPKDPDTKGIRYPHWKPVNLDSGRGSGIFEQACWQMVCLENEILDEDNMKGNIRLVLRASREWGDTGICDVLSYCSETGRLI